jgi:hypothetical protein
MKENWEPAGLGSMSIPTNLHSKIIQQTNTQFREVANREKKIDRNDINCCCNSEKACFFHLICIKHVWLVRCRLGVPCYHRKFHYKALHIEGDELAV